MFNKLQHALNSTLPSLLPSILISKIDIFSTSFYSFQLKCHLYTLPHRNSTFHVSYIKDTFSLKMYGISLIQKMKCSFIPKSPCQKTTHQQGTAVSEIRKKLLNLSQATLWVYLLPKLVLL